MTPAPPRSIPEFKQTPEVVFQPRVAGAFQRGMNKIVDAIRPSLGPNPRAVAINRLGSSRGPEFFDNGGMIARRIIQLSDRDEDAGAMYIRGALWNLHERVGDGVATSAIIFQTIFNGGLKYIAAGGNAMSLRRHLEQGGELIAAALDGIMQPISGAEALIGVAKTVCHEVQLAETLGNLVSIIGEEGLLEIRAGRGRGIEQELLAGSFWPGGLVSKAMITNPGQLRAVFENAALLISDLDIQTPQELLPVIQAAVEAGLDRLVVMCGKMSEPAQNLVLQSKNSGKLQIVVVKTPGLRSDLQMTNLTDIARLTGGRMFVKAAGETLAKVNPGDFGRARRIWANDEYIGLIHPQGDPVEIRKHVNTLRAALKSATKTDKQKIFQERLGRLLSGSAAIDVGGLTETEMETRKELAKRTLNTLRGAAREGILPGGGTALLACRPALSELTSADHGLDAQAARRILAAALEAPFRALMRNSGQNEGKRLGEVEQSGAGYGFDLVTGQLCEMLTAGIVDVATVQKQAVISAVRAASLALTIDVLIHRDDPPAVVEPDAPGF